MVRNVEERAGTSCYQNRGHTSLLIQVSRPLQKRRDGFFLPADNLLHKVIPHHKVRRGRIFIDQEQAASRLNSFHHTGRLRRASACIWRGKLLCVFAVWQVIDKQGNIGIPDGTPFFGTQFHRALICQDKLPSVSRNMVIHPHLQGGKQRGLSVVAAAHDQRDSGWNCHAADLTAMRQDKRLLHGLRGNKRNAVFHRLVGNAALSWQDGSVCHKRHHFPFFHLAAQLCLVFRQPDRI